VQKHDRAMIKFQGLMHPMLPIWQQAAPDLEYKSKGLAQNCLRKAFGER